MLDLKIGFLFKKRSVVYEMEIFEIFELEDYVVGISFTNIDGEKRCNILSGKQKGGYACLDYNANSEYIFEPDDLVNAIKSNDDDVNFNSIRIKQLSKPKYYLKNSKNLSLERIIRQDLINYLQQLDNLEENEKMTSFEPNNIIDMYTSIKKTIIAQDEQIKKILTSLFKNQKVVNSNFDLDLIAKLKENILVYGPTGTGKTEILKRISKLFGIPIVIEDATSLSEIGYEGRNVTDMLDDLCLAADGNIELAEKGILVIDEIDKLAEKLLATKSHVSRVGVQRSLLKLLDGATLYYNNKKFDTSKLTIVGLGAFTGIIDNDEYGKITENDFIEYGIMRELIGRFSKKIAMNPLKKEDFKRILIESDFSPLNTYKKMFDMLQVKYDFDDEFLEYISNLALEKQSGARSLKTLLDDCISGALFDVFTGEYSRISLVKPKDDNQHYILTKKLK